MLPTTVNDPAAAVPPAVCTVSAPEAAPFGTVTLIRVSYQYWIVSETLLRRTVPRVWPKPRPYRVTRLPCCTLVG